MGDALAFAALLEARGHWIGRVDGTSNRSVNMTATCTRCGGLYVAPVPSERDTLDLSTFPRCVVHMLSALR